LSGALIIAGYLALIWQCGWWGIGAVAVHLILQFSAAWLGFRVSPKEGRAPD